MPILAGVAAPGCPLLLIGRPLVALLLGRLLRTRLLGSRLLLLAGWGLLKYQRWARIVTIVLSCFDLLNFPFGTAIGVYGIWVLFSPQATALFERRDVRYS